MQSAIKVELKPSNKQRSMLRSFAGAKRFAYNWGLAERKRIYMENTGKDRFTDAMKQHKELNKLKKIKFNWMYNISKCVMQEALRDLQKGFSNLSNKNGNWKFPKFKKRGKSRDSFRLTGSIGLKHRKCGKNHTCNKLCLVNSSTGIKLPRLGVIRLKEVPDLNDIHIQSATVSRTADRWFVSLTVIKPKTKLKKIGKNNNVLGVDLGINTLGMVSNGHKYDNSKFLGNKLRKLRRVSKSLSRKKLGSNNRKRSKLELSRLHMRIKNSRNNVLHKMTTDIASRCDKVVIEDLNISGMMKNRKLSRNIADASWYEVRRMLEYKMGDDNIIIAPRFFPSSKLCSNCWWKNNDLELSDRVFVCIKCNNTLDRDLNAAKNLKLYGLMFTINPTVAMSFNETINACGEGVRPLDAFISLCEKNADDSGNLDES